MIRVEVTIVNKLGLHARAAAKFVTTASAFQCRIHVLRGEQVVNGKSIMGLMMLAAARGTTLCIIADGNDEQAAVRRLEKLVADRFGEAE
ncbi:MAG TPA: HPr family phosphocarrier protein [Gammaproteobacteria bacterium]|nr:HPr family phosphocarrier protein [Gammaproteobacteria bacterium]